MRQKWEYRLIHIGNDIERLPRELDALGDEGWEAVSAVEAHKPGASLLMEKIVVVILKRQKDQ